MSEIFGSESIAFSEISEKSSDIDRFQNKDKYSKRFPGRSDYILVKTHAYELFKENSARYANIF